MKTKIYKNRLKILLVLVLIIIIALLIIICRLPEKNDFSKFEPFTKNNVLINQKQNINLEENLPKIEAASAFYPFAANLVQNIYIEELYSNDLLKLVSTSEAFEDIIDGKADIIITTEPSDEQKKMIDESNVKLEFKALYFEPLTIYVNKENNIENLTIEQIQKIYYNNLEWNEFGINLNQIHTYPLLFEVYLIYRVDNNNDNITKIVNWLEKEEGKEFIEKIK